MPRGVSASFTLLIRTGTSSVLRSCCLCDNETLVGRSRALSFSLSGRFICVALDGGTSMGDEFRAAAFDEITGFSDDVLQDIENLTHAGLLVNEFGCWLTTRWVSSSMWFAARSAPAVGLGFIAAGVISRCCACLITKARESVKVRRRRSARAISY
jgi:hypothetical protein